jgi:RecA/RadA recombinase
MLNLACSDHHRGAFTTGKMVNLIGDSSSGKSFMAFTMLAQIAYNDLFADYRLIYDDVEQACDFDIAKLFGASFASRLEAPANEKDGSPIYSDTIQDFHMHIFDALEYTDDNNNKKPFIYVLDSFDALTSREEKETADKNIKALRANKKAAGSYGMEKPKILGQILRMIVSGMKESKSFLLIISQTRDNISVMSFSKKTRSGGRALKFYASHEIWLASRGKINKTTKGVERVIGTDVQAKVTKNKLTGKLRDADYPIYYDYGIDDIGPCVEFLVDTGFWDVRKQTIIATDFDLEATQAKLIKHIEETDQEQKLFAMAEKQWQTIENAVKLTRKSKFGK